jgi:hypothetical protein
MRTGFITAAVILAVVVAWLALGRQLVLLVDAFTTEGKAVATTGPFAHSTSAIYVADIPLDLTTPEGDREKARFDTDTTGRVSLHTADKIFSLGTRLEAAAETAVALAGPYDVVFAPDPGDTVTFRTAHSVIGWPTPFDLNFMTGNSPSWRRNTYYTLTWRKSDGATLEMTWRYEQWFYDDWASPMMTSAGRTGFIDATIAQP